MSHQKIHFKYHPNIYDLNIFYEANEGEYPICECCGKETKYAYETMYSTEDVECLCPGCIASGEAAKKFNGQFVQDAEDFKVNDDSKRDELYCRTPGYISWQGGSIGLEHLFQCLHCKKYHLWVDAD